MTNAQITERDMIRVRSLTNSIGVQRACEEVAGECFNEQTQEFEPFLEMQIALRERMRAEIQEFTDNGGY